MTTLLENDDPISDNSDTGSTCVYSQKLQTHKSGKVENRTLVIGCLNVCGLKRRALYPEFSEFINNFDILGTVETKLDSTDVISLQGYKFINCPRKQAVLRRSGDIGVYIKSDIASFIS